MSSRPQKLHVEVLGGIDEIANGHWNSLVRGGYPFLNHGFLAAMERHYCVGQRTGWIPRHLVYRDDDAEMLGAMPLYEKHNSWGEFVFDHGWADAYQRHGLDYYPKLVNAIPFTPAMGQRFLSRTGLEHDTGRLLIQAARTLAEEHGYSGVHCLFPEAREFDALNQQAAIRSDCQFHWFNRDYRTFDDFLATLKSKKRKNIRQERDKIARAGVSIRRLDGHSASPGDWQDFTRLYEKIYDRKYGMPAFNLEFFKSVAAALPDQVLLVLADQDSRCVAGALMYYDQDTLYGRHWGCDQYIDSLHFEVCYYQGIEFCIERDLTRFDPGAQGEHKIARGFEPILTRSLHWLCHSAFSAAIEEFCRAEQRHVQQYIEAVKQHSPYSP